MSLGDPDNLKDQTQSLVRIAHLVPLITATITLPCEAASTRAPAARPGLDCPARRTLCDVFHVVHLGPEALSVRCVTARHQRQALQQAQP